MRNIVGIMILLAIFTLDLYAETDCVCHRKVKEHEVGWWNWNQDCQCCYDNGVNCVKEPCNQRMGGSIIQLPGGYQLTLRLETVDLKVKDQTGQWHPYQRHGNNYPFDWADYIVISECLEFPHLVNREVELNGIVTDENGYFTVFISN
ncbi:MAG: hypothetical protein ABIK31_07055 [candidate division WOR-3 bacterium]